MKLEAINSIECRMFETRVANTGDIFRVIWLYDEMPTYEFFKAEKGYEEMGDAESGPTGLAETIEGWEMFGSGMGHPKLDELIGQYYSDETDEEWTSEAPSRGIGGQPI